VITPGTVDVDLFTNGYATFSLVNLVDNLQCGSIGYELIMVSAVNPNIQLISAASDNIKASPVDTVNHVGDFFYKIRACVLIEGTCVVSVESS